MRTPSREISIPFHFDGNGAVASVTSLSAIFNQRLTMIIMTMPPERLMLPTYGSPTRRYVWEALDPLIISELASLLQQAVTIWEPAVDVVDVTHTESGMEEGRLELLISYKVRPLQDVLTTIVNVGGSQTGTTSG